MSPPALLAFQLGLLLGTIGGLLVAAGALVALKRPRGAAPDTVRMIERSATLFGFVLMAAGLALQLATEIANVLGI